MNTNNILLAVNDLAQSLNLYICEINDDKIKSTFSEYIKLYLKEKVNSTKSSKNKLYFNSAKIIISYIKNKSFKDIDWNMLCSVMHSDTLITFLVNHDLLTDSIISKTSKAAKQLFKGYIIYLINNINYNSSAILQLRKYRNLIKESPESVTKSYLNPLTRTLLEKKVLTSYPLDSSIESIYQVYDKNKTKSYNLNLNTSNDFLLSLLKNFVDKLSITSRITPTYKIFYYFFSESFGNLKLPNKIEDFNTNTFTQQVEYYGELPEVIHFNGLLKANGKTANAIVPPQRIIIQFYIYLLEYIHNSNTDYDIFNNSWITIDLLKSPFFLRYFCDGYIYTYYNPLEDIPVYDKWWLNPGEDKKKSIAMIKSSSKIDFSQITDEKLRIKLKEWVWYGYDNSNILRRKAGFAPIVEFLQFKKKYEDSLKSVYFLNSSQKVEFPIELFYRFKIYYSKKYKNKKTLTEHLIFIRSFLHSIETDYNINPKCYKYLSVKKGNQDNLYGCPITPDDFHLILNEFKSLENKLEYGVLLTNIFYIATTSKLRPSEILSLERNCITYKDNDGNGTIKLKTKTSKGQYIPIELDAETIKLIESSIYISRNWCNMMQRPSDRNLIFVAKTLNNNFGNNYQPLGGVFASNFRNIILKLENKLSNYYTPYNLRDTFINIVYDNYEKYNETDIKKLQHITGNSYNVVIKHYRKKFKIREYVETMAKVTISDVDINGNILENEHNIKNKIEVNGDLGFCNKENCSHIPSLNYDPENKCLICNNFVTTLSRIKAFEKKIQSIRYELDNLDASDFIYDEKRKLLLTDLKLCCAYFTKMLEIKSASKK